MDKSAKQVVVLLAHPDIKSSQANKALADAIKEFGRSGDIQFV